ncbi:hypothetical protein TRFO_20711 [Tritrichomonas foetus]|uniref:Uncharacterized protein n=1 Tax=Tritrichomonas foetus TaxID=1144522 RepID=A0A1J4KF56_9EUKA|nr:hypothetical protein TRFO_20711 [Tritrichomonas foetus]|eukprot:OHT10089.1 hypothetical protein TRFO_20711 [Tritrichomonas foetus]
MQVDSSTTQMSFAQQAFSSVSVNGKYEGLIPKTPLKMIRNNIYQLMSYIDSAVPQFAPLHLVVSVIRILQIVGPSFCANYQDFWQPGIPKNAIGIISIFFHLIPNSARKYSSVYTLLVFGVIYFIFIFVMAVSVYFLKKTSKLPNALVYGISLFLSTFFMIVPPICTNLIGEVISRIIIGDRSFNFPLSGTLIVTFIDLLLVIFSVICFRFFLSVSLIFRPLSLQCVCPSPQVFINTLSIAITFITGLASHLPKIPQVVLSVFSAILYGLGCLTPFMPGTVIDLNLRKALLASFASGTFLQIVMIIFILIEFQATQITLFIILGILALSVLISNFIIKAIIKKKFSRT